MFNRRASSAVVFAVAGAVALSACSSGDDSSSSGSSASTSGSSSTTSSASAAAGKGGTVAGKTVAQQLTGALMKSKSFKMANTTPATGQKSTTKVQVKDGKMNAASTIQVQQTKVETVALDNGAQTYAKSPAMKLKNWTKLDPKSSNPALRKASTNIAAMSGITSPWNSFALLGKLQLTKAGEETVDGVKATKYTADVPAKMVLAVTPAAQRSLLAGVLGNKTTPLVQYVDAQGRPVKQTLTVNVAGTSQAVTTTWSDFGKPVTVSSRSDPKAPSGGPVSVRGGRAVDTPT